MGPGDGYTVGAYDTTYGTDQHFTDINQCKACLDRESGNYYFDSESYQADNCHSGPGTGTAPGLGQPIAIEGQYTCDNPGMVTGYG